MKIIIFGSTGMLGNYVNTYLSQYFNVYCINRKDFNIELSDWMKLEEIIKSISNKDDIIINCAGAIPHQNSNTRKYIILNTLFPHKLFEISKKYFLEFIHISTDCVFSGKEGNYHENSIHDSDDIYGITKSLGEDKSMCIIRTSIIGEEIYNKNSLIEWVIKQKNGIINGYDNVFWNGITCLQLSKIIKQIVSNKMYWKGIRHFYSPEIISKNELCNLINQIYKLNITILNKNYIKNKNMSLSSIYNIDNIPKIKDQLEEQYIYNIKNVEL